AIGLRDAGVGPFDTMWNITLAVGAGTLMLSGTNGLVGSGDGTGTLDYRGTLGALNAALEGLSYTSPAGYRGNTTLILNAHSYGAEPVQAEVSIVMTHGRFLVTTIDDSGPGSLRQAILDSNLAAGGNNTIAFAIPGPGAQTIELASPLPPITTPTLFDGF